MLSLLLGHWLSREVLFQVVMQGSRLCLIDTDSRRGDFLAAEDRKESTEGHEPTLKYLPWKWHHFSSITVHCPEPLAYPNVTSREAGRHGEDASGVWEAFSLAYFNNGCLIILSLTESLKYVEGSREQEKVESKISLTLLNSASRGQARHWVQGSTRKEAA